MEQKVKKETIWITGAGGFVGAYLTQYLAERNYNVHAFIRQSTNPWRLEKVKHLITLHKGALDSPDKIARLSRKYSPAYVLHLAAYGAYPAQQELDEAININFKMVLSLIEGLKQFPVKKFVVASSSSEYGKKEDMMKETDMLEPLSYYAITKAAQTHVAQMYARMYKTPITILRLFNVYGPLEEEGRLVRNVIHASLTNQPIKLATGKEARDFIYVEDVCRAFLKAMTTKKGVGEIYNVGTGKQTTIQQLAMLVKKLTKSTSPIMLNAYQGREWDNTHWKADTRKAKKELEFTATTNLSQGLIKTIEWYKKEIINNLPPSPAK